MEWLLEVLLEFFGKRALWIIAAVALVVAG